MPPIDRHAILAVARSLLGVPWHHQGRSRVPGTDCAGNILYIGWQLGVPLTDDAFYLRGVPRAVLDAACAERFVAIAVADARPGDIIQIEHPRAPCHLAILADKGHPYSLIQSGMHWGHTVEHGYVPPWTTWTVAAWSYPGVARWEE